MSVSLDGAEFRASPAKVGNFHGGVRQRGRQSCRTKYVVKVWRYLCILDSETQHGLQHLGAVIYTLTKKM